MNSFDHVRNEIIEGKLAKGLQILMEASKAGFPEDFSHAVSISQAFHNTEKQYHQGVLTREEYQTYINRIGQQVIELTKVLEQKPTAQYEGKDDLEKKEYDESPKKEVCFIGKHLRKSYSRNSSFLLKDVDITLRSREILAVVGKNAAGKTTLLNIIAGQLAADGGEISYPSLSAARKPNWTEIKRNIAYIPQVLRPWQGTLLENLQFEAAIRGIKGIQNQRAVEYALHRLKLEFHQDSYFQELSGGYKIRYELAKLLVWNPRIILMDEPLAHLDVEAQKIFLDDIYTMAKHRAEPLTVVLSSQDIHNIEEVADHLIFFRDGAVVFNDKREKLRDQFGGRVYEVQLSIVESTQEALAGHAKIIATQISNKLGGDLLNLKYQNGQFVLKCTPHYRSDMLIRDLLALTPVCNLEYFREISSSSKRFFYD